MNITELDVVSAITINELTAEQRIESYNEKMLKIQDYFYAQTAALKASKKLTNKNVTMIDHENFIKIAKVASDLENEIMLRMTKKGEL